MLVTWFKWNFLGAGDTNLAIFRVSKLASYRIAPKEVLLIAPERVANLDLRRKQTPQSGLDHPANLVFFFFLSL